MQEDKWQGRVERDGHFACLWLTPPQGIAEKMGERGYTLSQPIRIARADLLDPIDDYKGKIKISLEGKPELAPLVDEARRILAEISADDEANWAAQKLKQDQQDQPFIAAACEELAEWLRATPSDHVMLDCEYDATAADGWGMPTYRYQGTKIRPHVDLPKSSYRNHLATAVRAGERDSFWEMLCASAQRDAIRDAVERLTTLGKSQEAEEPTAAPGGWYCYSCETYCYGDCGDYAPSPQPRHMAAKIKEGMAEADYGIRD